MNAALRRLGCLPILGTTGAMLAGCANLLPQASVEASASFASYEAAQRAFEHIVPYKTAVGELKPLGFDPLGSQNVKIIPYPDLVGRLAPNAAVALTDLDPGIRDCILARMGCQAYEFRLAHETQERKGNFVLDFLNFRRTTVVAGWRFDAIVAVRDGVVLFRTFGGEPNNDRVERRINPLGPLQSGGESVAGRLLN